MRTRGGSIAAAAIANCANEQDAIKKLIEARFDAVSGADSGPVPPSSVPDPSPHKRSATNGSYDHDDSDASITPEPAKKKAKRSSSVEDADARLAAQLQAQENSLGRARTTRGADKPRGIKKKRAPKKKSATRVGEADDSDVDGSADSAPPKRKAGGGFQKPFNLSSPLSELVGETQVRGPTAHAWSCLRSANTVRATSCPARRWSRSYGSTSNPTTCKTRATSARYAATNTVSATEVTAPNDLLSLNVPSGK